jgi:hypothetical protein
MSPELPVELVKALVSNLPDELVKTKVSNLPVGLVKTPVSVLPVEPVETEHMFSNENLSEDYSRGEDKSRRLDVPKEQEKELEKNW